MSTDPRQRWFAQMIEAGLGEKIFEPHDVLEHVSADVLVQHLPPPIMTQLIRASLADGVMTPERVLETVTPEFLSEHIPHEVLWTCIASAAERAGMTKPIG